VMKDKDIISAFDRLMTEYPHLALKPSPEMITLVDQLVKEMPLRKNEDIDQWAENLADNVCILTD